MPWWVYIILALLIVLSIRASRRRRRDARYELLASRGMVLDLERALSGDSRVVSIQTLNMSTGNELWAIFQDNVSTERLAVSEKGPLEEEDLTMFRNGALILPIPNANMERQLLALYPAPSLAYSVMILR